MSDKKLAKEIATLKKLEQQAKDYAAVAGAQRKRLVQAQVAKDIALEIAAEAVEREAEEQRRYESAAAQERQYAVALAKYLRGEELS